MQHDPPVYTYCFQSQLSAQRSLLVHLGRYMQDPGDKAEMQEIIECIDTGSPFGLLSPPTYLPNLSLIH